MELQNSLKTVNNESASRRIEIKDLRKKLEEAGLEGKTELETATARVKQLETQHAEAAARLRKYDLQRAFTSAARKAEIVWASEQASDDAFELAYPSLVEKAIGEDGIDAKVVKETLTGLVESRKYLVTVKKAAETDGDKRNAADAQVATAEQLLQRKRAESPRL